MKTKRKFFPANTADIPALESWLEDMALEGLFPLSFNGYYAKFRQGEPQKMTYRIEVPKYVQAEPPKTMRDTYEDFGWQFVCHMWQKYYLFSSAEECPIEPHTDPLVQREQLEEAWQDSKQAFFAGFGVIILFLLLFSFMTWSQFSGFVRAFSPLEACFMLFVLLFAAGWTLFEVRTCSRIRRGLASGVPMEHKKSYRKAVFIQPLLILLMVLISFMPSLSIFFVSIKKPLEFAASVTTVPLPCLPLAELEGTEGKGQANVKFETSLLSPVQYTIQEYEENSYIETTYLEIRPKLFAEQTMVSLADNGCDFFGTFLKRQEIDIEPDLFDGLEYYHTGDNTILATYRGNAVLRVEYRGKGDLSEHLPAFAALLEENYTAPEQ